MTTLPRLLCNQRVIKSFRFRECNRLILRSLCSSLPKPELPPFDGNGNKYIKPPSKWRKWLGEKVFKFIEGYEEVLKKFPPVYRVYRVFSVGTKDIYRDFVEYMRISKELTFGRSARTLSFKELVIYYETPKSLWKVSPTLLISVLPFANYVIFPLAYAFPKQLLSHHFWTLEQKVNFQLESHTKRLGFFKPVLRHLQNKQSLIVDEKHKLDLNTVFEKLGSGQHPSVEEVVSIKHVFDSGHPYSMERLRSRHLSDLCRIHGLSSIVLPYGRRYRLMSHAGYLREMDIALTREGGSESLAVHDLRQACFLRGLNPINTKEEELVSWLNQWLRLSSFCDGHTFSLLLHSPIFLSYNHPSNWKLIYK